MNEDLAFKKDDNKEEQMNDNLQEHTLENLGPEERKNLTGLGGVLILVGFMLLLSLASGVSVMIKGPSGGLAPEVWQHTTEFFSGLAWMMRIEFLFNTLLIAACLYMLYLFFQKKRIFPKVFIIVTLVVSVYTLLDLAGASYFSGRYNLDMDLKVGATIVGLFVRALIWIPYMLKSWRVKLTFVN